MTPQSLRRWAALAFAIDALALYSTYLFELGHLHSRAFRIGRDRGVVELFGYAKLAAAIAAMHALRTSRSAPLWRAWSLLLTVMLCDDALGIHETLGGICAALLPLPAIGAARPQDLGELLSIGALYAGPLAQIARTSPIAWSRERTTALRSIAALGFLAAFGIVVDQKAMLGIDASYATQLIEEGGEALATTVLALALWLRAIQRPPSENAFTAPQAHPIASPALGVHR